MVGDRVFRVAFTSNQHSTLHHSAAILSTLNDLHSLVAILVVSYPVHQSVVEDFVSASIFLVPPTATQKCSSAFDPLMAHKESMSARKKRWSICGRE